jgi:hypothetical protein
LVTKGVRGNQSLSRCSSKELLRLGHPTPYRIDRQLFLQPIAVIISVALCYIGKQYWLTKSWRREECGEKTTSLF